MHQYWVYIMINKSNAVVYMGVTNDIQRRVFEHRVPPDHNAFAWKFQCWKLVHSEEYGDIDQAIAREKQLKNWKREWKDVLIQKENPDWNELSSGWD